MKHNCTMLFTFVWLTVLGRVDVFVCTFSEEALCVCVCGGGGGLLSTCAYTCISTEREHMLMSELRLITRFA